MAEKVQLDHLLLDVDFMNKPTITAFRRRYGWVAITWLIASYCQMSRATDGLVSEDCLGCLADDMRLENFAEMLAYCINEGLIDQQDGAYTNSRVQQDQESLAIKRSKARDRQDKVRGVTRDNNVTEAQQARDPDTVTDTVTELNNKNKTVSPPLAPTSPPNDWGGVSPPETENEKKAEFQLEQLGEGKTWEKDPRWMTAGWRPLKKYPALWMTRGDLVSVIERYTDSGIPHLIRDALNTAQRTIEGRKLSGDPRKYPAVLGWLNGYIREDLLNAETSAQRLQNSTTKSYQTGAR